MAGNWKWYVYHLIDPRSGKPFYVGKGSGNRMYDHGRSSDKTNPKKIEKIREIKRAGLEVVRKQIAFFRLEKDAYTFESKQIKEIDNLTNGAKGHVYGKRSFITIFFDCAKSREYDPEIELYKDAAKQNGHLWYMYCTIKDLGIKNGQTCWSS
jgi:hypothetical protein